MVSSYLVLLPLQYEDALESPLEQCISDSLVRNKDTGITSVGDLFSLVPSGVPKPSQAIVEEPEPKPISSPDSFSDFFTVLSGKCCCNTCAYIIARLIKMELVSGISVGDHELWEIFGWGVSGFNGPVLSDQPLLFLSCCSTFQTQESPEQVTKSERQKYLQSMEVSKIYIHKRKC